MLKYSQACSVAIIAVQAAGTGSTCSSAHPYWYAQMCRRTQAQGTNKVQEPRQKVGTGTTQQASSNRQAIRFCSSTTYSVHPVHRSQIRTCGTAAAGVVRSACSQIRTLLLCNVQALWGMGFQKYKSNHSKRSDDTRWNT